MVPAIFFSRPLWCCRSFMYIPDGDFFWKPHQHPILNHWGYHIGGIYIFHHGLSNLYDMILKLLCTFFRLIRAGLTNPIWINHQRWWLSSWSSSASKCTAWFFRMS
jgi:hypothetical protein